MILDGTSQTSIAGYTKVKTRDDSDFFITTYKDNPFLEDSLIQEIERLKETDIDYWRDMARPSRQKQSDYIYISRSKRNTCQCKIYSRHG